MIGRAVGRIAVWVVLSSATLWCATNSALPARLEYVAEVWDADRGLPDYGVTHFTQTPDGYLWIGTYEGLARFDGVRFDLFNHANTSPIPGRGVLSILHDSQGRLWSASDAGVACFDHGSWVAYGEAGSGRAILGVDIFEGGLEGNAREIFVLNAFHLFRFTTAGFVEVPLPASPGDYRGFSVHGSLWIYAKNFLANFRDGAWQTVPLPVGISGGDLLGAAASGDGGIWVASPGGISKLKNGVWTSPLTSPDGFRFTQSVSFLDDTDGNLWCGDSSRGLIEFRRDGRILRFTHDDGLPSLAIRALFEDREKNIWVGTHGGGMARFRSRAASLFQESSGLDEMQIDTVSARPAGGVLVSTYGGGLIQFDEERLSFRAIPERPGLSQLGPYSRVLTALEDKSGSIWATTSGTGTFLIHGSTVEKQPTGRFESKTVFQDSRGVMWFGPSPLLASRKDGKFTFYGEEQGIKAGQIAAIAEDKDGTIWVGGTSGLFRLRDSHFEEFTHSGPVTALYRSADEALWIGRESGALDRLWNGKLETFGPAQGLPGVRITSIVEDNEHRLWLGTFRDGLLCVSIESLNAVAEHRQPEVALIWLKRDDGLETNAFRAGYQPTASKTKDGRLWFATLKGLIMVDPRRVGTNSVLPPVFINSVRVEGRTIGIDPNNSATLQLRAGSKGLQIFYTALSFTAPRYVRFQYNLEGLDKDWIETGERSAAFGSLRPGNYVFRVKAANNDGLWNPTPSVVRFQIEPFIWERWWVELLAVAVLVAASMLFVYRYQRQKVLVRTRQLRTEQGLRRNVERLQSVLKASEERFETAFNASPIPLTISTINEGKYVEVNESFLRLTGLRRDEVIGRKRRDLDIWTDVSAVDQHLDAMKSGGQLSGMDVQVRNRDGQTLKMIVSAKSIDLGGVKHALTASLDITERKHLEEQLSQTRKLESIGRLSGGVAHDFNNLLTVINGYSSLLLLSAEIGEPHRDRVEQIRNAGERAADLTRQLLAFGRMAMINPKPLNLNAVVKETEKMLQRLLPENIEISTHLDAALGEIMADTTQMHQIVLNLALNARDAMPKGGQLIMETANVELDDQFCLTHPDMTPGPYVFLAVTDTGLGMEEPVRERIFEPFFTTKAAGQGTGLGLATVYGIVRQCNGWISVYSEPGKGASFKIYLPRLGAPLAPQGDAPRPMQSVRGNETVLVVDDQPEIRKLVTEVLQSHGYHVLEAGSGDEALKLAAQHSGTIHLLLTDLGMRGMTGDELAIVFTSRRSETQVLYMSGYTENAAVYQGVFQSANAFLQKPLTPDGLLTKVRQTIDGPAT